MKDNTKTVIDQQTATSNVDVDSHTISSSTSSLQLTSPSPSVQKSTPHKSKSWFNKLKSRIKGKDRNMNRQDDTHVINQKKIDDNPNDHQLSSSISNKQNGRESSEETDRIAGK